MRGFKGDGAAVLVRSAGGAGGGGVGGHASPRRIACRGSRRFDSRAHARSGAKFARRRTASAEGMYCRPEPTAQCLACEVLERQLAQRGGRYESIVREWATYTIRCVALAGAAAWRGCGVMATSQVLSFHAPQDTVRRGRAPGWGRRAWDGAASGVESGPSLGGPVPPRQSHV